MPIAGQVTLDVFDVNGQNVGARRASPSGRYKTDPYAAFYLPGTHSIPFDGASLASGIYIYRLTTADYSAMGKMVLLK